MAASIDKRVLITGATGFVGGSLLSKIKESAVVLGRSKPNGFNGVFFNRQLSSATNFSDCFKDIDVVVHCAARVHVMKEHVSDPLNAFRQVNVEGTLNLARQAALAGVKRFVFISSIKVNGENNKAGKPFTSMDSPSPEGSYAVTKAEAEAGLKEVSAKSGMEVTIIRPPLVYGPNVKGNLLSLLKIVNTGFPLPFGAVNNLRSMVYIENLVSLIVACIKSPNAGNKVFLASDGVDVSTTKLISLLRSCMNRPRRLVPVHYFLFYVAAKLFGKSDVVTRLFGSLQIDDSLTKQQLDWSAPFSVEEGLQDTVNYFLKQK